MANSLTFKIGADTAAFSSAIKTAMATLAGIGVAFVAVKKVASDFGDAIAMGGRLNDLSARTGETAGNLLILERAFENAGAGADNVGPALNRMQRFMVEASQRGGEQAKTMERLGLSYETLKDLSPTEQLQAVAKAISETSEPGLRTTAAMQMLGRSGGELIPLFRAMSTELETAKSQLGSTPRIMDAANQSFDAIGDSLGAIGEKSTEFAVGLISGVLPSIVELTKKLSEIDAAGIGEKFSEYARRAFEWADSVLGVGTALTRVEQGFNAIVSGDIGGGLNLIWLTMRDTALNSVNLISAAFSAAVNTIGSLVVSTAESIMRSGLIEKFTSNAGLQISKMILDGIMFGIDKFGQFFNFVVNGFRSTIDVVTRDFSGAFSNLVNFLASDLVRALTNPIGFATGKLASSLAQGAKEGAVKFEQEFDIAGNSVFKSAKSAISAVGDSLETQMQQNSVEIGNAFGQVMDNIKSDFNQAPENFKKSYDANVANPLIDMTEKMAETAAAAAKIEESLANSAQNMEEVAESAEKAASAMPEGYTPEGRASGLAGPPLPPPPPPPTASGGGGSSRAPTADFRRFDFNNQRLQKSIEKFESEGRFGAADNAQRQLDRRRSKELDRQAEREVTKGKNLQDLARENSRNREFRGEDIATRREKAEKELRDKIKDARDKLEGEIAPDGTAESVAAGTSGGGAGGKESTLEDFVKQIRDFVDTISQKLPQKALA